MFLSTMQTLPFEGHNVAYMCKGLNQSNIVCEYEVNLSTNEKVYNWKTKWLWPVNERVERIKTIWASFLYIELKPMNI